MYKIKCKGCDCVYIGQRSRALETRVKEHAKAIATLDENSLLAKHHMHHSHQIDWASVKIVDRSSAWRQRLILEAWHSVRDTNVINEHTVLSRFNLILTYMVYHQDAVRHLHFLSFAEEGNSSCRNVQHNILASVNFLNISFYF